MRTLSAAYDLQICPWMANSDQIQTNEIVEKSKFLHQVKINSIDEKKKESHLRKFNQLLEQHRERLTRKQRRGSLRSISTANIEETRNIAVRAQKWVEGTPPAKVEEYPRIQHSKSFNGSKMSEFYVDFYKITPDLHQIEEEGQQVLKKILKSRNKNATKFYGSLNKKIQAIEKSRLSNIFPRDKSKELGKFGSIDRQEYHTFDVTKIVEIKLMKYRPSKQVSKLKLMAQAKMQKKHNIKPPSQHHLLDRILVNF